MPWLDDSRQSFRALRPQRSRGAAGRRRPVIAEGATRENSGDYRRAMASPVRAARVLDAPLSVDRLLGIVLSPTVGGVALFLGVVRDHDQDAAVISLDYTQHPTAEQVLRRCAEQAAADHDVVAVAVEHRVGHLDIGELAWVGLPDDSQPAGAGAGAGAAVS